MALTCYVAEKPHDEVREEMVDVIPAGSFYLLADEHVARSVHPTPFVLITDTPSSVDFWVNGRLVKTHIPKGERDVVLLPLAQPPATNSIKVENGVDAPVHINVAATYITTVMDGIAEQLYEVRGRTNERYFNLLTSPWATFLVEWLIPWQRELPDVRSFRSMSLKMQANCLFGESGLDGAVRDFVSGFISSTPVVVESANETLWQPDTTQMYTSGDDLLSYDFHVWIPNLCLRRWSAFITYIHNTNKYHFVRADENVVMLRQKESEWYQQHLFDNTGAGCSLQGLLDAMGCMDRFTFAGALNLNSAPSFCVFANPFDMQVEYPGIGGEFFDAGTELDTAGHTLPDETNEVLADYCTDQATAITLATELRTDFNAHDLDATPTWHYAAGGSYQITAAVPSDVPTLITFCIDAQVQYAAHLADATMHSAADLLHPLSHTIVITSTILDVQAFLNDFKNKFLGHQTDGNFDSLYDLDLLTDYWVGTSTSKRLDGGGCFDMFSDTTVLPQNQECCYEGPDTKVLETMRLDDGVAAAVKPPHMVYGGDDPGILPDPYFGP